MELTFDLISNALAALFVTTRQGLMIPRSRSSCANESASSSTPRFFKVCEMALNDKPSGGEDFISLESLGIVDAMELSLDIMGQLGKPV